jgi:hypothetical protein
MLKQLAFAALAFASLTSVASARALTDEDWAALEELVIAHEAALHTKDAGAVIDLFPPAVLPLIAQMSGGVTVEVARQQGIDMMMQSAEGASFDAYDIDYDNSQGPYELSDGTTYVLMPTTMIELPGDGSVLKNEVTVAVLIEDQWYLMGFDANDEVQLLIAAYPAFGEPDFITNFAAALAVPRLAEQMSPALTEEQQAGLEARIATFDAAMRANDMATIMGVIPPAMLEKIATQYGLTTEQAIQATQQAMDEALKTVTFVSFSMDVDNATVAAQADGSPYLLIPTETVMDLGEAGGKIRATSQTLGLLDGETWYLIRVDDPAQVAIVKDLYPGLADVEFPPGSMEPVTE